MAKGMSETNEVVVDGVAYVQCHCPHTDFSGDPSGAWDRFGEKERDEIRRRMIAHLVEAGYFMRKDEYEKKNSIYGKDELFYGL
jgi:hypothetical protein